MKFLTHFTIAIKFSYHCVRGSNGYPFWHVSIWQVETHRFQLTINCFSKTDLSQKDSSE